MKRAMSAYGPKRTFPVALHMSAFGGKVLHCMSPLLTQSGHAFAADRRSRDYIIFAFQKIGAPNLRTSRTFLRKAVG
jgi:hypothetical protein